MDLFSGGNGWSAAQAACWERQIRLLGCSGAGDRSRLFEGEILTELSEERSGVGMSTLGTLVVASSGTFFAPTALLALEVSLFPGVREALDLLRVF